VISYQSNPELFVPLLLERSAKILEMLESGTLHWSKFPPHLIQNLVVRQKLNIHLVSGEFKLPNGIQFCIPECICEWEYVRDEDGKWGGNWVNVPNYRRLVYFYRESATYVDDLCNPPVKKLVPGRLRIIRNHSVATIQNAYLLAIAREIVAADMEVAA